MSTGDPGRDKALAILEDAFAQLAAIDGEGSLCTGWAAVIEWSSPEGEQFICRWAAPGFASWRRDGLFHYGLYGDWTASERSP